KPTKQARISGQKMTSVEGRECKAPRSIPSVTQQWLPHNTSRVEEPVIIMSFHRERKTKRKNPSFEGFQSHPSISQAKPPRVSPLLLLSSSSITHSRVAASYRPVSTRPPMTKVGTARIFISS